MSIGKILYLDWCRLVHSKSMIWGACGIAIYMLVMRLEDPQYSTVVEWVTGSMEVWSFVMVIMITYEVYGNCILEDMENHYLYAILREQKSLFLYSLSKMMIIFISCVLTTALGITLFALCCRLNMNWTGPQNDYLRGYSAFSTIYDQGHYLLWFILVGMQFGLLAGMMAMIGTIVSLFIENRILAGASTIIALTAFNQLEGIFWHRYSFGGGMHILGMYQAFYNAYHLSSGWLSHCLFLAGIFFIITTIIIYFRLKWRLRHE